MFVYNTMQKRILIVINGFQIGGTIVSLYSLLSKIDLTKVTVDIFPRRNTGAYANKLPNSTVLEENLWLSHTIYKGYFVKKINFFLLCIRKFFEKFGVNLYPLINYIGGKQIHTDKYDAVVGFDESLIKFISALPARKRINWIHCDYRRAAEGKDESRYFSKIDTIVCVSEFSKNIFCNIYPKYINKTVAIHNIINVDDIQYQGSMPTNDECFNNSDFTILSCGRLDPVKQFHLIPNIANKIKTLTLKKFRWYIIGGGNTQLYNQIQAKINDLKLTDCVFLLGMKQNPYPYMLRSDIFVCTSISESYPMVVNEAKALRIPVICNTFPSASESVQDGVNGYIAEIEKMPEIIVRLMSQPLKVDHYVNENKNILEQFYNLF